MNRLLVCLLTYAILLNGCAAYRKTITPNTTHDEKEQINDYITRKKGVLITKDDQKIHGNLFHIFTDSVKLVEFSSNEFRAFPYQDVKRIEAIDYENGPYKGIVYGVITGAAVGLLAGLALGNQKADCHSYENYSLSSLDDTVVPCNNGTTEMLSSILMGTVAGGLIGMFLGFTIGGATAGQLTINFQPAIPQK